MKNLIFVGGLQYSGKSSFCKKLEESDAKKYKHFELDSAYNHLVFHGDVFLDLIERYLPDTHIHIKELGKKRDIVGPDQIALFANYMNSIGHFKEFDQLTGGCSVLYTGESITKTENEIALIEGVFANKSTRKLVYNLLGASMDECENKIDLNSVNKLFVYFNLGPELSLERFRANPSKIKESMILSEAMIKQTCTDQEIPTSSEFPNLEVLVIENLDAVESAIKHVSMHDFIRN
jgi:hypothetical protein